MKKNEKQRRPAIHEWSQSVYAVGFAHFYYAFSLVNAFHVAVSVCCKECVPITPTPNRNDQHIHITEGSVGLWLVSLSINKKKCGLRRSFPLHLLWVWTCLCRREKASISASFTCMIYFRGILCSEIAAFQLDNLTRKRKRSLEKKFRCKLYSIST